MYFKLRDAAVVTSAGFKVHGTYLSTYSSLACTCNFRLVRHSMVTPTGSIQSRDTLGAWLNKYQWPELQK